MIAKKLFYTIFIGLVIGLTSSNTQAAEPSLAKVLWSNFDGKQHTIAASNYDGDEWSDPGVIHTSENPIASIAMGTINADRTLLVWTEQVKQKSQLFHKWFSSKTQDWSEAELLSDHGLENIGATIVVDSNNQLHLFWAANESELTDIIQMSYADDQWNTPKAIHAANDVPDIKPTAALDLNGNIVVSWSAYSFDAGQYIERKQIIETSQTVGTRTTTLRDIIKYEEIKVPNFLPANSSAYMHYPQNAMTQSTSLDPGQ